ncbi:uncharacterized protein [Gossypium hirsutum]|uniref:Retrotransposon gag domain-containing protein n=1 Tax=Gossypium hirsutum TaxID=3635 RepID=A0A1U8ITI9_GOSHI|nr:uncharacterized protein LOC107900203 [Gossypium hirsutum]
MPPRRVNVRASAQEDGLALERLRALGGKEFSRVKGTDPTIAKYWLEGFERILKQISCSDEEKLGCAVSLLDGEAHHWWNTVRRGTVTNRLTWNYFLEAFKRKYMGEQYMEARKRESLDLIQGDLSMTNYETKFLQLS